MATVQSLIPRVVMQAPGLSEPAAEMHLLDAAIDFCRSAHPVVTDLTAITVTAGDATYTLTTSAGLRVIKVMRLTLDGQVLNPVSPDALPDDWQTDDGQPRYYFLRNETDVVLYPAPDVGGSLVATVATAPTRNATTIDDTLADIWLDGIIAGALERALVTPNQPYSDPARAAYFKAEFAKAVADARLQSIKGYSRAPLRVQMQSF